MEAILVIRMVQSLQCLLQTKEYNQKLKNTHHKFLYKIYKLSFWTFPVISNFCNWDKPEQAPFSEQTNIINMLWS